MESKSPGFLLLVSSKMAKIQNKLAKKRPLRV
jgi:hypothetical protein